MHRAIRRLANVTAIAGGVVLVFLVLLTVTSIGGRILSDILHSEVLARVLGSAAESLSNLGIGEVSGSYELLEAGVAFAIFSFFPICQLSGSHAAVDIFTTHLPERASRVLAAVWETALTAALLLISVQLFGGVQRYYGNGETTLFLQFPVWWAYAASFAASVATCIVAVYCMVIRIGACFTGRDLLERADP